MNKNEGRMARFRENVIRICTDKGWQIKDLAEAMGISYQSVYSLMNRNPTVQKIEEMAAALGVPPSALLESAEQATMRCPHCGKPIIATLRKPTEIQGGED